MVCCFALVLLINLLDPLAAVDVDAVSPSLEDVSRVKEAINKASLPSRQSQVFDAEPENRFLTRLSLACADPSPFVRSTVTWITNHPTLVSLLSWSNMALEVSLASCPSAMQMMSA